MRSRSAEFRVAESLVALGSAALLLAGLSACGSSASTPSSSAPGTPSGDAAADASALISDAGHSDSTTPPPGDAGGDASHSAADASLTEGGSAKPGDAGAGGGDASAVVAPPLGAGCAQTLADGTSPPSTTSFISPTRPVTPFYQWINNNGYCGEVSVIQAGMNNGQWTSQYNSRLLCGGQGNGKDAPVGTPLLQSGPDASCDQNAQLLLDNTSSDRAPLCLSNFGLAYELYDYASEPTGAAGYQNFMSWIKGRTIAGDNVAIGVLDSNGNDTEYDHIVTVVKVGTNHGTTDTTYYDDDVLYFDDHGLLTFEDGGVTGNPAVPPGTDADTHGCTPYVFGYAFSALGTTSTAAHASGAHAYSIVIPGSGKNYGFAVSGPMASDAGSPLLPVTLSVIGSSTGGAPNQLSPLVGYNYEAPMIGAKDDGTSCTNDPPASWMAISLEATVNGLTSGTSYNLYEYDFASVTGIGTAAALPLPTSSFNAHASQATVVVPFVASGATYTYLVPPRASNQTVVFRAVRADAP